MFTFDWRILKLKSHFWYVVIANIDFCNGSTFSRRLNQGRAILHASSLLVTIRSFIIRLFNSLMLLSGLKEAFALLFVPLYRPIAKMLFIFFFLSFPFFSFGVVIYFSSFSAIGRESHLIGIFQEEEANRHIDSRTSRHQQTQWLANVTGESDLTSSSFSFFSSSNLSLSSFLFLFFHFLSACRLQLWTYQSFYLIYVVRAVCGNKADRIFSFWNQAMRTWKTKQKNTSQLWQKEWGESLFLIRFPFKSFQAVPSEN